MTLSEQKGGLFSQTQAGRSRFVVVFPACWVGSVKNDDDVITNTQPCWSIERNLLCTTVEKENTPFCQRKMKQLVVSLATLPLFVFLFADCSIAALTTSSNVVGIWKLVSKELPRTEPTIVQRALGRSAVAVDQYDRTPVLLKLNPNGTFRQCNEGYVEGAWIVGRWTLLTPKHVCLALHRQYYGPSYDVAFDGQLQREENGKLCVHGSVCKAKFILPSSAPNFFQDGFADATVMGPFHMELVTSGVDVALVDGAILGDDSVFQ